MAHLKDEPSAKFSTAHFDDRVSGLASALKEDAPGGISIFCLHFLGGSGREWETVADLGAPDLSIVPIDLHGFGESARLTGFSVDDMAQQILRVVRLSGAEDWLLVGHSMGAKVAMAVARQVEDFLASSRLLGLVLIAGSPPGPEPMDEAQRETMKTWFLGDAGSSRAEAKTYITQNVANSLPPALEHQAIEDVLRMNRDAWIAWLDHGSREDWSARIGVLQTPALVVAGSDDDDLGPDAQARLTLPHLANARIVTLPGKKHLLPLEAPEQILGLIADHVRAVRESDHDPYFRLIRSDRVGANTRNALLERARPDVADYQATALTQAQLTVLRAVLGRVLPQQSEPFIDMAARIDQLLAAGTGDGWRRQELPGDVAAYKAGLDTLNAISAALHRQPFAALNAAHQDSILAGIAAGDPALANPSAMPALFSTRQLKLWFEDCRADAIRIYVSHPATLQRMGYGGIANGGDGAPKSGFVRVGLDQREAWEPLGNP